MPIIETKFGTFYILTKLWWNVVKDDWSLDEKIVLVKDSDYNIVHL